MAANAKIAFTSARVMAALEARFLSNDLHKRASLRQYFKAQFVRPLA